MSETPTPRMDLACDNLDDCLDWEQVAYRVAAQGQELERELTAERAARERAEAENATLRGLLGNSGKPCAHCGLPVEQWGECVHGFPGCARADDAQLSDLFAVRAALAEAEAGRVQAEAERDALRARVAELEAIAAMLGAVVQGAQEEFVRVPYGASHEDVAQINEWHKMAQEARAALAALERGDGKEGYLPSTDEERVFAEALRQSVQVVDAKEGP